MRFIAIPAAFQPIVVCAIALLSPTGLHADVRLPALFSDQMVIQREVLVPVWGWADPGETITVELAGKSAKTTANAKGKWMLKLDKPSAAGPTTLIVRGKNTLTISDVLIGEVWLASGQSNMAMAVKEAQDAKEEIASANFPEIRMFNVARRVAAEPQEDCGGKWTVCSPETVAGFAATAYYFGRDLHQELKLPVGLINSSWGGTTIEGWTSLPAQESEPALAPLLQSWETKLKLPFDQEAADAKYKEQFTAWRSEVEKAKAEGVKAPGQPKKAIAPELQPNRPANIFNAMIAPLIPYAIRGNIWYQGESNASEPQARRYDKQLPLLITDWRKRWNQGDFPFAWVQLPFFKDRGIDPNAPSGWALIREAMTKTLAVPNTGMAICIDLGQADNIHPLRKQPVGKRLASWAKAEVYGIKGPYSGPLMKSHEINGAEITVSFEHADGGLVAKEGPLKGFAVAGRDKKWVYAEARILENGQVVVSSPMVKRPAAVRYAWADNPECNLYNAAGFSASPFRTDDW